MLATMDLLMKRKYTLAIIFKYGNHTKGLFKVTDNPVY